MTAAVVLVPKLSYREAAPTDTAAMALPDDGSAVAIDSTKVEEASFCQGTIPLMFLFVAAAGALRLGWKEKMLQVSAAVLVLFGLFMVQNNLALTGISLPALSGSSASVAATVKGDTQVLTTYLQANGYDDIEVTVGIPVVWTIIAQPEALNGCNSELVLPAFGQQVILTEGENVITFTPEETGTYSYSCWMGMLRNTITVNEKKS